jgi:hypothetical protein
MEARGEMGRDGERDDSNGRQMKAIDGWKTRGKHEGVAHRDWTAR